MKSMGINWYKIYSHGNWEDSRLWKFRGFTVGTSHGNWEDSRLWKVRVRGYEVVQFHTGIGVIHIHMEF